MKKIIFICVIFLIGCEKESIELESPNLLKKYQYEIKKILQVIQKSLDWVKERSVFQKF